MSMRGAPTAVSHTQLKQEACAIILMDVINMWNGNNKKDQITKDEEKRIDDVRIKNGLKPLFRKG